MGHFLVKTYKLFQNHFEWIVIPFLVFMILKGLLFPLEHRKPSDDIILTTIDSVSISNVERETRLQNLLNSIHQHGNAITEYNVARESVKMQGRILFITLFSGLITVLYSVKKMPQYRYIAFTALLLGIFWYGINVFKLDIENRELPTFDMINNTETKLLNILPDDNRFYNLDYTKLQKVRDAGQDGHRIRKIKLFFTPDITDIVFNLTPLLIFVVLYTLKKRSMVLPNQALKLTE